MDTAIGIFASSERAEEALLRLLKNQIPEHRVVYLTGSQKDAEQVSKRMSASESLAAGSPMHAVQSGSLMPGLGLVYALGIGGGNTATSGNPNANPWSSEASLFSSLMGTASAQDKQFFQQLLNEGQSVVIVRTNSPRDAVTACQIFDELAAHMKRSGSTRTSVIFRRIPGGAMAEFSGKLTLTDGNALLRESIQNFLNFGYKQILLDLERLEYVDSAGLGELVRSYATVQGHGGRLTIVRPSPGVLRLMQITKLDKVFNIASDQASALRAERHSA